MNNRMVGGPIAVLLVEDNPDDADLTREVLQETNVRMELNVVHDGVEAIAFLRHEGKYWGVPRPDLILLDLNMPRKDGWEVLVEIKGDDALKLIPVVILTTSEAEEDIAAAYSYHANCYVIKPVDLDQFIQVVNSIENFWLTTVKLPPPDSSLITIC